MADEKPATKKKPATPVSCRAVVEVVYAGERYKVGKTLQVPSDHWLLKGGYVERARSTKKKGGG